MWTAAGLCVEVQETYAKDEAFDAFAAETEAHL